VTVKGEKLMFVFDCINPKTQKQLLVVVLHIFFDRPLHHFFFSVYCFVHGSNNHTNNPKAEGREHQFVENIIFSFSLLEVACRPSLSASRMPMQSYRH
jgi:hypothetical protein